jgi:hypothetical protein
MRKYLKISNNGCLDIRLVSLMGGTTKDTNEYKIGQFGSGLKYTLAYLLRNKVDFKIFINSKEVKLGIVIEHIQGEDFEIITVNGEKTSITTKMGKDWKPWMIVRELYSNALDEGDAEYKIVREDEIEQSSANRTTFYIELNPDFLEVYNSWNKYFIVGNEPMYENRRFAFHPCKGNLLIYKQGILIHEDKDFKSIFNIDIKNAEINELREYKGSLWWDFPEAISSIDDKKTIEYLLENLITDEECKYYESKCEIDTTYTKRVLSNAWKEVIGQSKIIDRETLNKIQGKNVNVDTSNIIVLPKNIYLSLSSKFEGISAIRVASKIGEFYEVFDTDLELKVKQALVILEESNYFIHPELKFLFGEFGSKDTLARVDLDKKEILISQKMKDKSMFDFLAMLIEENEHFQTGFDDCTRSFQQHFINLYAKSILDKAKIKL